MASTICVTPEKVGVFHVHSISDETIRKANQLLQTNHNEFHIMWNWERGLHNHQVHYLLTDLALGASPEQIQGAFDNNEDYMQPILKDDQTVEPIGESNFASSLGLYANYPVWMQYFQEKIDSRGWHTVLSQYLFDRSPRANDLLGRMFEGAIHPIIHLGFGVEFEQPAIIAEALAQAAVHKFDAGVFLLETEKLSQSMDRQSSPPSISIVDLINEARSDTSITSADCWKGHSFEKNGNFFSKLPANLVKLTARYNIEKSESALTKAVAEMMNVCAWFSAAAQRRDKEVKFDFFYMHCVNCSIFLDVFAKLPGLSLEDKIRLVEWKVRYDLIVYVCQGSPELWTDEIVNYQVRRSDSMSWPVIFDRAKNIPCDGHVVKMIRALKHASELSRPFESQSSNETSFQVKGDMWLKIANMVLDSTEDHPSVLDKWTRGPGFDSCWDVVHPRKRIEPSDLN